MTHLQLSSPSPSVIGLSQKLSCIASNLKLLLTHTKGRRNSDTEQEQSQLSAARPDASKSTPSILAAAGSVQPIAAKASLSSDDAALARALQQHYNTEVQQDDGSDVDVAPGPGHAVSFLATPLSSSGIGPAHSREHPASLPPPEPICAPPSRADVPSSSNLALDSKSPKLQPLLPSRQACAGCGRPLFGLGSLFGNSGRYITALHRCWHPDCFNCAACGQAFGGVGEMQFLAGERDGLPYHLDCHKQLFHPRCSVCKGNLPMQV